MAEKNIPEYTLLTTYSDLFIFLSSDNGDTEAEEIERAKHISISMWQSLARLKLTESELLRTKDLFQNAKTRKEKEALKVCCGQIAGAAVLDLNPRRDQKRVQKLTEALVDFIHQSYPKE